MNLVNMFMSIILYCQKYSTLLKLLIQLQHQNTIIQKKLL